MAKFQFEVSTAQILFSLFLWFLCLQGCATTIMCEFSTSPPGAQIYGGPTPDRMDYVGITPYTQTFRAVGPYWLRSYYQFKKEGFYDSIIIVAAQLPVNTNRKVWALLEKKAMPEIESTLPNKVAFYTGTGWVTQHGYIITNYHVVEGQFEIKVRFNSIGTNTYEAVVVLFDQVNDLAILKLINDKMIKLRGIPISTSQPKIGEEVFTIGYPQTAIMGNNPKITNGIISSLSGLYDDPRIIQTTVPIQSGNSGGPLLNMKGEAIGVTMATLHPLISKERIDIPQNVNYAVKSAYVVALLSSTSGSRDIQMITLPTSKLEDIVPKIQDSIVQIIVKSSK